MACVEELLRKESDGGLSFGNHNLAEKKKVENFKSGNDLYKVKTFKELTKLEKNDMFLYESDPGTSVFDLKEEDNGISFYVCGTEDVQITVGMAEDTEYSVFIDGVDTGKVKTNLSGKLSISVELDESKKVEIKIVK
ncbi:MAG: endosialidase [Lachnospiraceae bacterium]|nr:endosialidase [Lachnospiraceae bacterium]